MIFLLYALVCVIFYALFISLNVVGRTMSLLALFRDAAGIMSDSAKSDLEKEREIRRAAIASLGRTADLVGRMALVLGAAGLPVAVLHVTAGLDLGRFMDFSLHPGVLVGTVVVLASLDMARRKLAR